MNCDMQSFIPELVCLGSVESGSVVIFPNEEDNPKLVTNQCRKHEVTGGNVDTIGVVDCKSGKLFWFSDRYDCVVIKDCALIYRLPGGGRSYL